MEVSLEELTLANE